MLKINLLKKLHSKDSSLQESTNNFKSKTNWQLDLKNSITTAEELSKFLNTTIPQSNFPIFVTKAMAIKIKEKGPQSSLWKQFVPTDKEFDLNGFSDPIGDNEKYSSNQLIHRYQNRVLFLPNVNCPIHCRFCFRQHSLTSNNILFKPKIKETLNYLNNHPEIEELIFSGGDPLLMSNDKLFQYFNLFREKTNIKYIRLHTKSLTTLPSRFDQQFFDMIKASSKMFKKFVIVFHCNNIDELDGNHGEQTQLIIKKLKRSNIDLLLQSVLLRNINDDIESLKNLFLTFSEFGVRPYYLHHPDRVKNAMHYYLPIEEGRLLYGKLRTQLPGWAIPHYVVDLPLGRGKTLAFNSETSQFSGHFLDQFGQSCKYI